MVDLVTETFFVTNKVIKPLDDPHVMLGSLILEIWAKVFDCSWHQHTDSHCDIINCVLLTYVAYLRPFWGLFNQPQWVLRGSGVGPLDCRLIVS